MGKLYSHSNITDVLELFKDTKFKYKYNVIYVCGSNNKATLIKNMIHFKKIIKMDMRREKLERKKLNNDNEPKRAGE